MAGDSGPEAGAKGIVEDVKGKAKDAIGNLTGNEAEKARAEAQAQEAQQRANQQ